MIESALACLLHEGVRALEVGSGVHSLRAIGFSSRDEQQTDS